VERHVNNKITEKGTWFSPPEEQFRTFLHSDCDTQKNQKWHVYYDGEHPSIPQEEISVVCGVD
jgi:hypothetical protein